MLKRYFIGTAAALLAAVLLFTQEAHGIGAQKAILLDAYSGRTLYEKQPDSRSLIASTTKIMTALVVCEQCNVLDRVKIPKEAVGIEGSSVYLTEGEVLTVQELLYGMMLDRMSLSIKNGWMDENERVYIYFTVEEVCEQFCCHTGKAVKMFNELETENGIGLIQRKKLGQGKPARIYVMRFLGVTESSAGAKEKTRLAIIKNLNLRKSKAKTCENRKVIILIRIILILVRLIYQSIRRSRHRWM
jgi:hypothetical protein